MLVIGLVFAILRDTTSVTMLARMNLRSNAASAGRFLAYAIASFGEPWAVAGSCKKISVIMGLSIQFMLAKGMAPASHTDRVSKAALEPHLIRTAKNHPPRAAIDPVGWSDYDGDERQGQDGPEPKECDHVYASISNRVYADSLLVCWKLLDQVEQHQPCYTYLLAPSGAVASESVAQYAGVLWATKTSQVQRRPWE